jgi:UDP-N-acetylglucosamine 2-epimerase
MVTNHRREVQRLIKLVDDVRHLLNQIQDDASKLYVVLNCLPEDKVQALGLLELAKHFLLASPSVEDATSAALKYIS